MTVYVASDEITVNTTTARTQAQSDITQLADGNMLVVWVDADFNTTANRYIRAQVYDADGTALSPELTLLSGSAYIQPEVTALPDGNFVLTWDDMYGIRAQIFSGNGTAISPIMQVSPLNVSGTSSHDVVTLAGGGFAISWQDERTSGGDTSRLGIHVRTYDASGNAIGDTLVNVATSGNQQDPAITALADGGFVVTWSDHGTPGSGAPRQIKGRVFDSTGTPTGGEFLIGNPADGTSSVESSVTTLASGNFAVAWWQVGYHRIQVFDTTGTPVGPQTVLQANYGGSNPVVGPELIGLADGGFAIAWIGNYGSQSDGSGTGIYVQAFDAAGQPAMEPTLVNVQTNGDQLLPTLAALPNGGFMVSWTDLNGTGADDDQVKARLFAPQPEGLVVDGTSANDTLSGAGGDDVLNGLAGNDTLSGLAGNDTLDGGTGADTLVGGTGDDIYIVDSGSDIVTENAGEGADTVRASVTHTLRDHVENLILTGSNNSSGYGNALANVLTGNAGYNRLYGLGGDDMLIGGEGGDTLDGGTGGDAMTGGTGDDSYYVDGAADQVTELAGEGADTVNSSISYTLGANFENLVLTGTAHLNGTGNALANRLTGNSGNNWLQGGDGNDWLVGYAGGDILDGGAGNDTMYGGVGSDIYVIDAAGDQVIEYADGGWLDIAHSYVTTTIPMHVEILSLVGSADLTAFGNQYGNELQGNEGANALYGRAGGDTLRGNAGADLLKGEDGDDIIWGGEGRDELHGGAGADSFSFQSGDFAGLTSADCDRIVDFSQAQSDTISLNEVDANDMDFGDQAFSFIGDAVFTGAAGELRYYQNGANTFVEGDTNGDGLGDFLIRLDGLHSLTGSDFML